MEDHVHGPECEEKSRELRNVRASALVSVYSEDKRDALLQAAHAAIEKTRNAFGGMTDEQVGDVMEVLGDVLHQVMLMPAYALSDALTDSSTAYTIAAAHLLAGFELPEKSDDLVLSSTWEKFLEEHEDETAVKLSEIPDDFRPGNYL